MDNKPQILLNQRFGLVFKNKMMDKKGVDNNV